MLRIGDEDGFGPEPADGRVPPPAANGPLVTVVIPAFNAAATLAATLRSVSRQTHADLEILVIDDGSTDETAAIALHFCRDEKRARLLRQENRGVAAARNLGLREARGDYIATLDADDLWHPAKIERQVAAMLRAPEPPGFVYTFCRRIDMQDRVFHQDVQFDVTGPAFWRHVYWNFAGNGSSILARKSVLLEAGGFDESQRQAGLEGTEDFLLQLQISKAWPIVCVPEYLVGYRLTPGAMSADQTKMQRSWLRAADILRRGPLPPGPGRVFAWTAARTWYAMAITELRRGRPIAASAYAARAAWQDPVHTLLQSGRSARRLMRRWLTPPAPVHLPQFESCDPADSLPHQSWPAPGPTPWMTRLELRRLKRLGRIDAPLHSEAGDVAPPAVSHQATGTPAIQGAAL
jgi:hypothetical protein